MKKMFEKPMLMVLTGGTICSVLNEREETESNADQTVTRLEKMLEDSAGSYRELVFVREKPMDILSENMTVAGWNRLTGYLKTVNWPEYSGVIVLHGTDTLAYGAALLAVLLAGAPVPVCLVSSNYRLDDNRSNGFANFRSAVDLIVGGIRPGVYVPYRNDDGNMWIHRGAHLEQCKAHSVNFHSDMKMSVCQALGQPGVIPGKRMLLDNLAQLDDCVLQLHPYVGINYSRFRLEGVRAVVHGVYHSSTACVGEPTGNRPDERPHSILHLLRTCRSRGIDVFLAPVPEDFDNREEYNLYSSTGTILREGGILLRGMTPEMSYVKTLIACSMFTQRAQRLDFLEADVCGERLTGKDGAERN